jgi:predicted PurR-regulated permease PerM
MAPPRASVLCSSDSTSEFSIGVTLCFMGLIPYLGITLCWIPAVIIASVQDGSWLVPAGAAWWVFPLVVTGIFVAVQQVDGLFITPKIVGESVGLHPMTVIVSVFVWTFSWVVCSARSSPCR